LDTVTPPSTILGPLIFNGYSHTTMEETRLYKNTTLNGQVSASKREFESFEGAKLNFHFHIHQRSLTTRFEGGIYNPPSTCLTQPKQVRRHTKERNKRKAT